MIDGFVGKLLDLGAERGIFYSAAGFTDGAIRRADRQRNPNIALEHLDASPAPVPSYETANMVIGRVSLEAPGAYMGRSVSLDMQEPLITSPIVDTYEEFLRGEGFLYNEA